MSSLFPPPSYVHVFPPSWNLSSRVFALSIIHSRALFLHLLLAVFFKWFLPFNSFQSSLGQSLSPSISVCFVAPFLPWTLTGDPFSSLRGFPPFRLPLMPVPGHCSPPLFPKLTSDRGGNLVFGFRWKMFFPVLRGPSFGYP